MGVTVASFADLARSGKDGRGAGEMTDRFMYKINALVFSRFEEVLLLDSDNIALRDLNELFESSLYRERGSLLWMDFWRGSAAPDCAFVLATPRARRYTHESGQMLVDKRRSWEALSLALFMNAHSDFFYPLSVGYMGLGDKELVALAFNHLGRRYGLVPHGPDHVGVRDHDRAEVLGNTMMQHSPDGTPFFMHANLGKPTPFVPVRSRRTFGGGKQHDPREGVPESPERSRGGGRFRKMVLRALTRPRVLVRRQTAEALVPHPGHRAVRGGFPRLGSLQHQR